VTPERWLKIEELFQTAVDLSEAKRSEFLDSISADDPGLRSEVEKLLASNDSARDFIESSVWTDNSFLNTSVKRELSNSLDNGTGHPDGDGMIGKQIGAYKLTREIGRGGMGAVYMADRADGEFKQRVAIKLIKRGMDSDFIIRRFRHERQILASFEHPFIARLLDGGTTEDNVPYFVMEFIEGETLYNYCDTKRLNIRERLKIFQKVCAAIEYAHERQIIHRDIKPGNILINQSGSPKLLDFGIAKILDPDLIHESVNPTASMLRMMTPDYASPEQVQGIEITPSSDIYSLGVLLYELLTGHRAYNFAGRALHEVSQVVCEVMPTPPSTVITMAEQLLPQYTKSPSWFLEARKTTAKELKEQLEGDLDSILMKTLAKDPAGRYPCAKELSKDISRYLSGGRVEAASYDRPQKPRMDAFPQVPENSRAVAVLPFKFLNLGPADDTDDRFLGLGLADALITRLSKVRRFIVRPTSSILGFGGEDHTDPIRAGKQLNVDYILDGSIKKAGSRLRVTVQLLSVKENAAVWATSIDETLSDVLTLEDTLSNKVIEVLLPQLTGSELQEFAKRGTEIPEAFEHYLRGRYHFNSFTEDGLAKSFVSFHRAIAADPNYALAYAGIADYYNWLGMIGVLPPQECFVPAIEAAQKAIELDPELSEAHASLGFSLHAGRYDWAGGERHLLKALNLNPSNANAYVWYAIVLFTEGRFDEALEFARRSIDLDPLTPFNYHNIGWGLYYARRFDEAVAHYRKMISDFPTYSFGYYGISKVHRKVGDTKIAIVENEKANELMGGSVFSQLSEAECYAADGQTGIAAEKIRKLEEMSLERYVSPYQLALVYCYLGEKEKALANLEKAREIKEAWLNWMGVEPAFDPIRDDPRFDNILESIGYRMLFKNFSASGTNLGADPDDGFDADGFDSGPYNKTTLVIDGGERTQDGLTSTFGKSRSRWLIYAVAGLAIIAAIAGAISLATKFWPDKDAVVRTTPYQSPIIVVLPFRTTDGVLPTIGIGFADALSVKLGNIKNLQVISPNSGRAVSEMGTAAIGRDLGATFVVRGELVDSSVRAELVDTAEERVLWSESFPVTDTGLFAAQTKVAERVWTSLGIEPLQLERQQVEKSYTQNAHAYELYLLGRSQMVPRTSANIRAAIETFNQSLRLDGNFALAYVGLSDAYSLLNLYDVSPPPDAYQRAKFYAGKALAIDNDLAEAHASMAYVKYYHDRDRAGSELEFRRAIQVNPSYAQSHHWFALVLAAMNKPAEAIQEIEHAQHLDPRSPTVWSAAGVVYYLSGRFEEATAQADRALSLDERMVSAYKVKRWAYTAMRNRDAAMDAFHSEVQFSGGGIEQPGWQIIHNQIEAISGDKDSTIKRIDTAAADPSVRDNPFFFAFEIALAYNAAGETQKALDYLERSEAAGSHSFNLIEAEPRLVNLHTEPRFQRLLLKLRGPKSG
jgi:serine/threonine protein kinase/tetratricopeptide (TPR) repeat protein